MSTAVRDSTRFHYEDRAWRDTDPLARSGHWTAAEALEVLRNAVWSNDLRNERVASVMQWVRRDLDADPSAPWRRDPDEIYAQVAATGRGEEMFRSGRDALDTAGYGALVHGIDAWAVERFAGLGCPWTTRLPAQGERVLDLGCGAGVDHHIAAAAIGTSGIAFGIDRRPQLVRATASRLPNAVIALARAEACPLPSGWATTVIANGLPPLIRSDTLADVLREVARVLRPGGWFQCAVLVTGPDLPFEDVDDLLLLNSVRYGKPLCAEYRRALARADFDETTMSFEVSPFVPGFRHGDVAGALITSRRA